jgi:hypothetical protein
MREKMMIGVMLTDDPPEVWGTGDRWMLNLIQKVNVGPKPTLDKRVNLVLNKEETFDLAMKLLSSLPANWLAEGNCLDRLKEVVRVIDVPKSR